MNLAAERLKQNEYQEITFITAISDVRIAATRFSRREQQLITREGSEFSISYNWVKLRPTQVSSISSSFNQVRLIMFSDTIIMFQSMFHVSCNMCHVRCCQRSCHVIG